MRASAWLESLNAVALVFVDAALRGAVVLLAALAITHMMRRRTAAARHLVWVGAIVIQLALPAFAVWGPQWRFPVPDPVAKVMPVDLRETPAADLVDIENTPRSSVRDVVTAAPPIPMPDQRYLRTVVVPGRVTGKSVLVVLWLAGAAIILARLAVGTTIVASLARKGNRVDDGNWLSLAQKLSANLQIDRPLTLLRGTRIGVPITWGIIYPIVLLPDDAGTWPEERRRFVLVHEMAHVKRLDALTQLAGQFALALFWFNPLVWIANRRMQLEREHACDDYVIRHGTSPSQYAEDLLSMVRSLGAPEQRGAQPAFAALAMARRSEFEGRMLSILDPVLDRHPLSKGRTFASACAALLLVVPLAALHPYQRAPAARAQGTHSLVPIGVTKGAVLPATPSVRGGAEAMAPSTPRETTTVKEKPFAEGLEAMRAGVASMAQGALELTSKAAMAKSPGCDNARFGGTDEVTSSHIHADTDDNGSTIIDLTKVSGTRCTSALIVGATKYSPDETDIAQMPAGAHAQFRERTATDDRMLTVRSGNEGIVRSYRRNGQDMPYDADVRRWFATLLPAVLMDAGMNVEARVARWRAQGGVDNVLAQIATMSSTGAKHSHYQALLSGKDLSPDELDKVVRSASTTMKGSSGDLRSVLMAAAKKARLSRQGLTALESALASMGASGDMSAVLQVYGQTADRDMLLMVMRASEGIGSSGDRARLHQVLAARYLATGDRDLHGTWFDHAVQIGSSGDLRNTLMIAVPYAESSTDVAHRLIEASRSIGSAGDRSAVMISLVSSHAITTKELRDEFYKAASEIQSDGDRSRVLQSAAAVLR